MICLLIRISTDGFNETSQSRRGQDATVIYQDYKTFSVQCISSKSPLAYRWKSALSTCGRMSMKTSSPSWRFKDCSTLVKKFTCLLCTDAFCITFNIIFSHSRKHGVSTDSEKQTTIHPCTSGCCTERRDKICHRHMTIWSIFVLVCKTLLSVVDMSLFLLC